jgi:hypothetical protein
MPTRRRRVRRRGTRRPGGRVLWVVTGGPPDRPTAPTTAVCVGRQAADPRRAVRFRPVAGPAGVPVTVVCGDRGTGKTHLARLLAGGWQPSLLIDLYGVGGSPGRQGRAAGPLRHGTGGVAAARQLDPARPARVLVDADAWRSRRLDPADLAAACTPAARILDRGGLVVLDHLGDVHAGLRPVLADRAGRTARRPPAGVVVVTAHPGSLAEVADLAGVMFVFDLSGFRDREAARQLAAGWGVQLRWGWLRRGACLHVTADGTAVGVDVNPREAAP